MSATMTEQEIQEEQRRVAAHRELVKRAAICMSSWESCLQYFSFAEVCSISNEFYDRVDGDSPPWSCNMQKALGVAEAWLRERWGSADRGLEKLSIPREIALEAQGLAGSPPEHEATWSFQDVLCFVYHCQALHLQKERTSGFDTGDIQEFREIYDEYDTGTGLFARELFDALKAVGFTFPTMKEQNYVVDLVRLVDVDKSGTIDFHEFLHMLRALIDRRKVLVRRREHALIIRSGLPLDEVEDWLLLFQTAENEDKSIMMGDVKDLFGRIDLTWGWEESNLISAWLREVDEDSNGLIDFGEFCCLVQKMWDRDFANIKRKAHMATPPKSRDGRMPSKQSLFSGDAHPATVSVKKCWTADMIHLIETTLEPKSEKTQEQLEFFDDVINPKPVVEEEEESARDSSKELRRESKRTGTMASVRRDSKN
eukprot:TRINITY_DN39744_c0_g1_i1.p1 TRINITY_DN39744_c0_g1~~TRINITY_DN39744_c0_g1_i1.p1  ORF type:complete len:426 (+),score=130.75 TRINITY_DN39744_c0_g1_i1:144-1421(+)